MKTRHLVLAVLLGSSFSLCAQPAPAQDKPVNLALGKVATFDPAPNYALCTDPDDKWQLTDGKFSSEGPLATVENTTSIWVQKGTVGWSGKQPIISFDLGQVEPISGVMFSTAAGRAGVEFPAAIFVGVSDDNHVWRSAGDLVELSNRNGAPPTDHYTTWRYATHGLHVHGRYIAFSVVGQPYIFCDEIEIYRGADAWVNEPATGPRFSDMREFTQMNLARSYIARRLSNDLRDVRAELASSPLPATRRQALAAQLDALAPMCRTEAIPAIDPATFRAMVPVNDTDAQILAVHGAILATNHTPLVLWHQHRYQWLPLLAVPPSNPVPPVLEITLMKNEFRSDSLLLTNAGTTALPATVKIESRYAPAVAALTVSAVPFTDTSAGTPVAAALPVLAATSNGYAFSIPAGLTTKLWITVDAHQLAPGSYKARLNVQAGGTARQVPFEVRVSPITMPTPRLSLGMWDYVDGDAYGLTKAVEAPAIAMMRSHFVDTAWASGSALPSAQASNFDAQNNLVAPLNWKNFDAWVAKWPDSRNHFIFASVGNDFAGAALGTPAFDARVGAWARAFSSGLQDRKMDPAHVAVLLVDEPHDDAQATTIAGWEHAIKATAPEVTIFEDPTWERPDQVANQACLTQADILSPNLSVYSKGGASVVAYFDARRAAGQKIWFYQCSGPARLFDPTSYHRLQAWHAFEHGAQGAEFWAFGDNGGSPSSWDEYLNQNNAFTPVFLDANSVTNGIHWDAVREGVEDYEYLSMLRDRIATATDQDWKARASHLLETAPAAVTGGAAPDYFWKDNPNDGLADQYRLQALTLLETAK